MKKGCLIAFNERPNLEIKATSLMFSEGSKDLDDWKERFIFIHPKMSSSAQDIWSMCNRWTLDTKHKRSSFEAIKESASRIMVPSRDWKEE